MSPVCTSTGSTTTTSGVTSVMKHRVRLRPAPSISTTCATCGAPTSAARSTWSIPSAAVRAERLRGRGGHLDRRTCTVPIGLATVDTVFSNLVMALLPALSKPEQMNRLFADYTLRAMTAHLARSYGSSRSLPAGARGGLASWQERRAKELLQGGSVRPDQPAGIGERLPVVVEPFQSGVQADGGLPAAPVAAPPARRACQGADPEYDAAAERDCSGHGLRRPEPLHTGVLAAGQDEPRRLAPRPGPMRKIRRESQEREIANLRHQNRGRRMQMTSRRPRDLGSIHVCRQIGSLHDSGRATNSCWCRN